jgi:hypothetical protein
MVPEKVGLKGITRDGLDYEFTVVFDIDIKHNATASKDRTGLFMDKPPLVISDAVGTQINTWCNMGISDDSLRDYLMEQIECADSINELKELYYQYPIYQEELGTNFKLKKEELKNEPSEV